LARRIEKEIEHTLIPDCSVGEIDTSEITSESEQSEAYSHPDLNRQIHRSNLGPELRGTLIVVGNNSVALVLLTSTTVETIQILESGGVNVAAIDRSLDHAIQLSKIGLDKDSSIGTYHWICEGVLAQTDFLRQVLCKTTAQSEHDEPMRSSLLNRCYNRMQLSVGGAINEREIFLAWARANLVGEGQPTVSTPVAGWQTSSMICFDPLDDSDDVQFLEPCGHCVCSNCWVDYLRSIALSRQRALFLARLINAIPQ
jgi:hypothetical protein